MQIVVNMCAPSPAFGVWARARPARTPGAKMPRPARTHIIDLNTFKFSGLASKKAVLIAPAGEGLDVVLGTTKTKKGNKPANSINKSVMRRDFRTMAKAVINQVAGNCYRPDLKAAALARLSSVHKSLRVAKAGKKGGKVGRKAARS